MSDDIIEVGESVDIEVAVDADGNVIGAVIDDVIVATGEEGTIVDETIDLLDSEGNLVAEDEIVSVFDADGKLVGQEETVVLAVE